MKSLLMLLVFIIIMIIGGVLAIHDTIENDRLRDSLDEFCKSNGYDAYEDYSGYCYKIVNNVLHKRYVALLEDKMYFIEEDKP